MRGGNWISRQTKRWVGMQTGPILMFTRMIVQHNGRIASGSLVAEALSCTSGWRRNGMRRTRTESLFRAHTWSDPALLKYRTGCAHTYSRTKMLGECQLESYEWATVQFVFLRSSTQPVHSLPQRQQRPRCFSLPHHLQLRRHFVLIGCVADTGKRK